MFWFLIIIGVMTVLYYISHNTGTPHSTTDYKLSRMYFDGYPYVLYYLKELTMAMNELWVAGVITCPITEGEIDSMDLKQLKVLRVFNEALQNLVAATLNEHHIEGKYHNITKVRNSICDDLRKFRECYPNWPMAYQFANNTFFVHPEKADNVICVAMQECCGVVKFYGFE